MTKFQKSLVPLSKLVGKILKWTRLPIFIDGMKIIFPDEMTDWERGFTLISTYEKNERKLVKKYINKNDKVLELGACIGVVSITINKILEDKSKQVSIEPNVNMLKYLEKNREKNQCPFFIDHAIVSIENEVEFYDAGEAFLSSSTKGNGKSTKIKGITIEELEKKYFNFTAVVMDIEGGELELLRNFDLTNSHIQKIIWETHGNNILSKDELNECYNLLKKYGYHFIDNSKNVEYWGKTTVNEAV